jgi:hydrogenase maturation protease
VTGVTSLVIGIGNRSRGDDAVGPEVASRVAQLGLVGVAVVVLDEPIALVEQFGTHDDVVVVDATDSRGHPGRVHVRQVGRAPLRRDPPALGSHGLGVADAVELARVLGRLPRRLTLVGVEARTFRLGAPLSAQVRESLDDAAEAVVTALPATCSAGSDARPHE